MMTLSPKELELEPEPEPLQRGNRNRKQWTREDCDFLERVGFLTERYELLDGEIIEKVGQNQPHIIVTMQTLFWLAGVYGNNRVQCQADIEVAEADSPSNRPQPDIAVLSKPITDFGEATPTGQEVLLVVEVSDSTLREDLLSKSFLYARAGIPEYWVVDVKGRRIYSHINLIDGAYTSLSIFTDTDSISTLSAPAASIRVSDLLPPVA